MKSFLYDNIDLINLIRDRPAIWNKHCDEYKSKALRDQAWEDVCECLDSSYLNMSEERKKKLRVIVIRKWLNIKDAFRKSLRTKKEGSQTKEYYAAKHLGFLLNMYQHNDNEMDSGHETKYLTPEYTYHEQYLDEDASSDFDTSKKRKSDSDCDEKEILVVGEPKRPKIFCESYLSEPETKSRDDMFFASFVPYVSNMTEDEKLDLHMEIIMAIKRIKNKDSSNSDS